MIRVGAGDSSTAGASPPRLAPPRLSYPPHLAPPHPRPPQPPPFARAPLVLRGGGGVAGRGGAPPPRLAPAVLSSRPIWAPSLPGPPKARAFPSAPSRPLQGGPGPSHPRLLRSPTENPAGMFDSGSPLCDSPPQIGPSARSTRTSRCRAPSSALGLQRLAFSAGIGRPPSPARTFPSSADRAWPFRSRGAAPNSFFGAYRPHRTLAFILALGCALATNQSDPTQAAPAACWLPTSDLHRDRD